MRITISARMSQAENQSADEKKIHSSELSAELLSVFSVLVYWRAAVRYSVILFIRKINLGSYL